jgi:hypothetical protein
MTRPNVMFIKDTIYQMEHDYGVELTYYVVEKSDMNLETGKVNVTRKSYRIKKAIELGTKLQRQFIQDIAYLAANKNFTYGALFDQNKSVYLIGRRQLPRGVEINLNNFFIRGHKRFVIDSADILEHGCGWVVTVKNHEGASPFETHKLTVRNKIEYQHDIQGVLNG